MARSIRVPYPLPEMSLFALPSRLPARKHLIAGVMGLLGMGLMIAAVLTASGFSSPFSSSGAESVQTDAINVAEGATTTAPAAPASPPNTSETANPAVPPLLAFPGTTTPGSPNTTAPPNRPTTTSTSTLPPTTVPTLLPPLGNLGQSLSGG